MKKLSKESFKEAFRKFIVSLKRRPHNIVLVFMLITYIVYSFNLSNISHTTAVVNVTPMGICSFIIMLFSILSMVSFLNAFPPRCKPKKSMVIVLYVIQGLLIAADLVYLFALQSGLDRYPEVLAKKSNSFIAETKALVIVHVIMLVVSTVLIVLIPLIGKLFNRIDTSIKVEETTDIKEIELEQE